MEQTAIATNPGKGEILISIVPTLRLEKEMTAHSSILAWGTPWTGEPGRLQSMGLQRVSHETEQLTHTHIHTHTHTRTLHYFLKCQIFNKNL